MVTYENVFVFLICKKLICRVQPSFIDSFNAFTVQKWIEMCEMLAEKTKLFLLAAYLTQRGLFIWKHLLRFWTLFLNASCITSYLPVQHLLGQLTKTTESVRWPCYKKNLLILSVENLQYFPFEISKGCGRLVSSPGCTPPVTFDRWLERNQQGILETEIIGETSTPSRELLGFINQSKELKKKRIKCKK